MRTLLLLVAPLLLLACAALRDDMRRAEAAFDDSRPEDASTWLADLEPHVGEMEQPMRARFYYLRGATALQRGDERGAKHYLALCREEITAGGAESLRSEWKTHLDASLAKLETEEQPTVAPSASETVDDVTEMADDEVPPPVEL